MFIPLRRRLFAIVAGCVGAPLALCGAAGVCSTAAAMEEGTAIVHVSLAGSAEQNTAAQIDRLRMLADAGRDEAALAALLQQAEHGRADAQRAAGEVLLSRANSSAAKAGLLWLGRAAKQGDQRAALRLGKAWLLGATGHPPNAENARAWLQRIDTHSPEAAYYLGLIDRAEAHHASAMTRFRFAAERGLADAMYQLGNGYAHGQGVDTDPREAMRWYLRAASLDHPQAIQEIAFAFARGDTLLPQSDLQAANMRAALAHALRHPKTAP